MTRIVVTAAVVEVEARLLVTRRLAGTHLEGYWEFPGGKCDPGETHEQCLEREIGEELGTGVRVFEEVHTVAHTYPDRIVELHFFRCELTGEPRAVMGQEMRWVPRDQLTSLQFPPADAELIESLVRER